MTKFKHDIAKKNFPNGKFICDDFIKSEIAEYDLIISFDVIDHVYNPNKFLKNNYNFTLT